MKIFNRCFLILFFSMLGVFSASGYASTLILTSAFTLTSALVQTSASTSATSSVVNFDHFVWDSLLKKHVTSIRNGQTTQVDYAGFSADRNQLKKYLTSLSSVTRAEFDHWKRPSQLAFLINAYNAYTVELILTSYPKVSSIKNLGSFLQSPWKKDFIFLLGETRSLDDTEHRLIRGSGRYADPRIHFAVNCASIGCPALRTEAFVAERLEAQLENATILFLSDRLRNRLEGDTLKVSSIFKWYRDDFKQGWRGTNDLHQFFILYRQSLELNDSTTQRLMVNKIGIEFLDYDWRLNSKVQR